jgi:hypothetical protein
MKIKYPMQPVHLPKEEDYQHAPCLEKKPHPKDE